jgi:choline dehydrogenase-like flavoprotein
VLGRYLHDHPVAKIVVDVGQRMPVHPAAYVSRPSLERSTPLYAGACAQWTGMNLIAKSVLGGHPNRMSWIGFSVFGTMAPKNEQNVAIDESKRTADGAASVSLHVRHPQESKELLENTRDEMLEMLFNAGLSPSLRVWKIESAGNAHHYGGICRMHASPRFGMLDAWSRLHAVPNVAVVDSAAFTTGPEKNPVLTAMALAARASDKLARDLKSGSL